MEKRCRICGNVMSNTIHEVEERMFNMGESFEYLECSRCGTLQLNMRDINLGAYYPNHYGGFIVGEEASGKAGQILNRLMAGVLVNFSYIVSEKINYILKQKYDYLQCFFGLRIKKKSRILDVGCGSGRWLAKLADLGYSNLTGVDLYNHNENRKFNFVAGDIFSVPDNKEFDVITLHHSFEHMDFPQKVLSRCRKLLADNGIMIIRIPVMGKYAWKKYGTFWSQIDAPRHLYLYTEKSLNYLLRKCGFKITDVHYDSKPFFQINVSELYKNTRLSLEMAKRRGDLEKKDEQQEKFVKRLNKTHNGDQAIFLVKKQ